jgi:hypothetical protein
MCMLEQQRRVGHGQEMKLSKNLCILWDPATKMAGRYGNGIEVFKSAIVLSGHVGTYLSSSISNINANIPTHRHISVGKQGRDKPNPPPSSRS